MSRLRLRQFSLSVAYFSSLHRCGSHFCFILITWNFLSSSYFIGYAKFVGLNFLYNAAFDNKYFVTLKKEPLSQFFVHVILYFMDLIR